MSAAARRPVAASVLLLPVLLGLAACETTPPPPEVAPVEAAEVATVAAEVFCRSANMVWQDCSAEGPVASFQGSSVTFESSKPSFVALPPKTIGMGSATEEVPGEIQLSFELSIAVDGNPLISGKVSHAASDPDLEAARVKAIDESAQRFIVGHGLGVIDALIGQPSSAALNSLGMSAEPQAIGDTPWRAYPAYPVVKGQGFDPSVVKKMAPQVQSMAREVSAYLAGEMEGGQEGTLHAVKVEAKLGGSGSPGPCGIVPPTVITSGSSVSIVPLEGTVFVDGVKAVDGAIVAGKPGICGLSEPVAWPLPVGGAVLEWTQVVVLRRGAVEVE